MKKILLSLLAAAPFLVNAQQNVVFSQKFDHTVSSYAPDYKLSSNTSGSVIRNDKSVRFDSFGATTLPTGVTYSVDAAGLKINKTGSNNVAATAQVKGLVPTNGASADVAFIQFNLSVQTDKAFAANGSTPLFVFAGEGFASNSNNDADHNNNQYMPLAFYFPTPNSTDFGIKVGTTSVGTFSGTQKITWVINRTAGPITYTGPGGTSSTVDPAKYDVWVGTTKVDLSAVTITPANSGTKGLTDFRIRTAVDWNGYAAFKDVNIGYLKTDGTGDIGDSNNYVFSQPFDNTVSATLLDYKLASNGGNMPRGTVSGPIADTKDARFESLGAITVPASTSYFIDADGFKINKVSGAAGQATAQVKNLAPTDGVASADVAFAQFDLSVQTNTQFLASGTSPLLFFAGQGYASNTNNDDNSANYATLGFYFPTANSNQFGIKVGSTGVGSTYSGTQKITWVINRTENPVTYTGPGGASSTLASAKYDIWVGTTKLDLSSVTVAPANAGKTLTDFRIRTAATWIGYAAFKNLTIGYLPTDGSAVLPVKLTSFTAKTQGSSVNLNWQTATESNFSHFDVTRSTDGANFIKIGERAAKGPSTYSYTDFSPAKGNNYYQLISQDKDGKSEKSEIATAKVAATALEVNVESSSAQAVDLGISALKGGKAKITLANISGQVITNTDATLNTGYNKVSVATTYKGVIIATVTTAEASISKKTIK